MSSPSTPSSPQQQAQIVESILQFLVPSTPPTTSSLSQTDRIQRSLLLIQVAKLVLSPSLFSPSSSLALFNPRQCAIVVRNIPYLVSKCFFSCSPEEISNCDDLLSSASTSIASQSSSSSFSSLLVSIVRATSTSSSSPSSSEIFTSSASTTTTDTPDLVAEYYRNLIRSFFVLAIRRSIAFKTCSVVDVRKSVVELLLGCQVFEVVNTNTNITTHQQVLAATIAVTGLKITRLVSSSSSSSSNDNKNNKKHNNNNNNSNQIYHKSSGLPSNLITALTNSLRNVPQKLKSLADARKYRKRGLFEGKEDQEKNLQLVSALRIPILNILQILFEDGVSPASTYSTPIIREVGYKRRDFEVASVAAFVSFSSEISAVENNLHGVATLLLSSKIISSSSSFSGSNYNNNNNNNNGMTKTSLKNSYINGEFRNALFDDDTTMQLSLLKLCLRRITILKIMIEQQQQQQFLNDNDQDDVEEISAENQNPILDEITIAKDFSALASILIPLLNSSADVLISVAACSILSFAIEEVFLKFNTTGFSFFFSSEQQMGETTEETATNRKNIIESSYSSLSSAIASIQETLRTLALRAIGTLELDSISQSIACLSKILHRITNLAKNPNQQQQQQQQNDKNNNNLKLLWIKILLQNFHSSYASASNNNSTSSPNVLLKSTSISHLINCNRLIFHTAYSSQIVSSSYSLRIRRLGFILSAKLFELLQTKENQEQQEEHDEHMTAFLEWMSHAGLSLNCVVSNAQSKNEKQDPSSSSSNEVSIDALHCGLKFLKNELKESSQNEDELYLESFNQLCCNFELRLM